MSRARSRGDLGIGLSIVKSLVSMHGGSVAAQSEGPGRGSVGELLADYGYEVHVRYHPLWIGRRRCWHLQ